MLTAANPSTARRGFSTRAIWSGQEPCAATGATIVPVYQTATFTLPEVGVSKGFDYSRSGNPTRLALERQIASLEEGARASAFGSGMAAVAGAVSLLRCGDHLLATRDIYGGTHRLFTQVLPAYGIDVTFVDTTDVETTWAQVRPNTRMLWLETPSNPALSLADIAAFARTKPRGVLVAVDNTFASPFLQRPLVLGADLVVHSTTKYICGHSDVVGGAVVAADDARRRTNCVPSKCGRRRARPLGRLPHAAGRENAGAADAARTRATRSALRSFFPRATTSRRFVIPDCRDTRSTTSRGGRWRASAAS